MAMIVALNEDPCKCDQHHAIVAGRLVCLDTNAPSLISWLGSVVALCEDYPPIDEHNYYDSFVMLGMQTGKAIVTTSSPATI